ncbi:type II secretion system F family protein [Vibrio sp. SCSIO 43137]|uniref:type II secretion system F family protein n=1 Tax=Vibrio sp. SCSIO 43137 TaxID=3021011 RepID=UPI00230777C6|nr:type II secretion system F family protein [Vibrio sp. SCSIO 43137]WCE32560.1 type II secretion system F family protein [Vibrio sp. SCSIO 43137]
MNFLLIFIVLASCILYLLLEQRSNKKQLDIWLNIDSDKQNKNEKVNVIDFRNFDLNFNNRMLRSIGKIIRVFNPNAPLKIILFFLITALLCHWVNHLFFRFTYWKCLLIVEPILFYLFYNKLKQHQENKFRDQFPDALNILVSAFSSGQGIVQAFEYVGNQLDNEIGKEFEYMAKRFLIGEAHDDVLERSSQRFPYLEYFFFISAIRVNIARGGQLKELIGRINRLIFVSRNIEKKKNSLTSEARMSAKIIGFLPVVFLMILYFTNVESYNFVMYEDAGKPIFYYVLVSELIGFFVIRLILRGVK